MGETESPQVTLDLLGRILEGSLSTEASWVEGRNCGR